MNQNVQPEEAAKLPPHAALATCMSARKVRVQSDITRADELVNVALAASFKHDHRLVVLGGLNALHYEVSRSNKRGAMKLLAKINSTKVEYEKPDEQTAPGAGDRQT